MFVGDTDYSNQSLSDMVEDINNLVQDIKSTQKFFLQKIKQLKKTGYWNTKILSDFKTLIAKSLSLL